MIGQATAHRRATAFAQALEDAVVPETATGEQRGPTGGAPSAQGAQSAHGAHGSHAAARHADPEQATLLALAASLTERPRPVLDAEVKTVQRAQLIAAMEQALADGSFPVTPRVPEQRTEGTRREVHGSHRLRKLTPKTKLSRRLAVGGLTMGVAAGAFGGVAAASTNALPGDTLYGLKRGMEDLKLDMASGDASRGKVYLDMAATRMQEARRLMDRGRGGQLDPESVGEVRKALSGMHQEASEGHRLLSQAYQDDGSLQPMETLNSFAAAHRQGWSDLRGKLPSQLSDVSNQVSSVFDAIDQEVAPLRSVLPKPKHSEESATPHAGDDGSGPSSAGTGPSDGTGSAAPSASAGAGGKGGGTPGADGTHSAVPSPSGTAPSGLIGGSGNLLPPVPPSAPGTPSGPASPPTHSVTLPPLLPGLLPGLGLGGEDDHEG